MIRTNLWVLNGGITAVYCKNLTKDANTLPGRNAEFLMLKYVVHSTTTVF